MGSKKFNGNRLRNARICKGVSLTDFAKEVNMTKQSISLYENGKITPDSEKIFQLSKILDFPVDYFFQYDCMIAKTYTTYFRSSASATKKVDYPKA